MLLRGTWALSLEGLLRDGGVSGLRDQGFLSWGFRVFQSRFVGSISVPGLPGMLDPIPCKPSLLSNEALLKNELNTARNKNSNSGSKEGLATKGFWAPVL